MKSGKRGWLIAGALFVAGLLTVAFWPVSSPLLWTYPITPNMFNVATVAPDGTIYISNHVGELTALNPDGTVKWKIWLGPTVITQLALGSDGTIYAPLYISGPNVGLASISPAGHTNWIFRATGPVLGRPALGIDGTIYFGSHDSNLHALNPDGTERWHFATQGRISSSPVIAPGGTIAFVSEDTNCYVLNPDGTLQWQTLLKHQRYRERAFSPALAPNGSLILGVWSNVVALGAEGIIDWKTDLFVRDATGKTIASAWGDAAPMVAATGDIFITTSSGDVHALAANGEFRWSYDRGFGSSFGPKLTPLTGGALLVAYEKTFQVPIGANRFAYGTSDAAVVQLGADGREVWRVKLPGRFDWKRLFNSSDFQYERQIGFGLQAYQDLSQPVAGPDGTIYIRSNRGLHAIRPPKMD